VQVNLNWRANTCSKSTKLHGKQINFNLYTCKRTAFLTSSFNANVRLH